MLEPWIDSLISYLIDSLIFPEDEAIDSRIDSRIDSLMIFDYPAIDYRIFESPMIDYLITDS